MHNLHGKTIVEDNQAVDRPCKVQKVHLVSSTSESVLHFTTHAEDKLHLPSDVSSALDLHTDNPKPVKIQNLKCEVQELFTTSQKTNTGFNYATVRWSSYLRSCNIAFGDELSLEFHKSTQLLKLTKVVHFVTKIKSS
ncbi:uncharacterized protein LOC110871061 [Helianthus annuus]|uniref:uncharacterized protein LOC110871061 n=1 Tax=Helianthus annuus TaxID=4232 RepID=UPI000B8F9953|nr:uncharacterized protein LOC110871061 [Helianthus annuus]